MTETAAASPPTPSATLRGAAPDLARRLGLVLVGLCTAIKLGSAGKPLPRALFDLAYMRVNRIRNRLVHLLARLAAGWRPRPAAPRAVPAEPRDPAAPRRTRVCAPALGRLPHGRTWLVRVVGYRAAGSASQLEHLLADPAMAELVATVPSVGRMLRPLCHILGISPPVLGFPPPPPPRPAKAARPKRETQSAISLVHAALAAMPAPEPSPPRNYCFATSVLAR
jgi:hypothetical protein